VIKSRVDCIDSDNIDSQLLKLWNVSFPNGARLFRKEVSILASRQLSSVRTRIVVNPFERNVLSRTRIKELLSLDYSRTDQIASTVLSYYSGGE
jgi:hypothetical protein